MFADSAGTRSDIVLYDRVTDQLRRITNRIGSPSGPGDLISLNAVINGDGSTISFVSSATNLGVTGPGYLTYARTSRDLQPVAHRVTLFPQISAVGVDFGNYEQIGAVSGVQFDDVNGNGQRDSGELPLPNVTVYLDIDNDEFLDSNEPSQVTGSDGTYRFEQLMPGTHTVRAITTGNDRYQTSNVETRNRMFGVSVSSINSAFRIRLTEFSPTTGTVIQTTIPSIDPIASPINLGTAFDGKHVFILNPSNRTLYKLLPSGQVIDQTIISTGQGTLYAGLACIHGLLYFIESIGGWTNIVAYDPQNNQVVRRVPMTHSLDGYNVPLVTSFPSIGGGLGESADGSSLILTSAEPPGTGTTDKRILRLDPVTGRVTNYFSENGSLRFSTSSLINDLSVTGFGGEIYIGFNSTIGRILVFDDTGNYQRSLSPRPNGALTNYVGLGSGLYRDTGSRITLAPSQSNATIDVGHRLIASGSIRGQLYEDLNGNGNQDSGELPLVGNSVYIDLNRNYRLDSGEPNTITDTSGNYQLDNVPPGDYSVRVIPAVGYRVTSTPQALRLFASRVSGTDHLIVELDPITGATLNQFAAPTVVSSSLSSGLAFDGTYLYYIRSGTSTLYTIDPDSGSAVRSMILPSVPTNAPSYQGLAELNGLVYVVDTVSDTIFETEPTTSSIRRALDLNAINPNYFGDGSRIELGSGLSESADRTRLFSSYSRSAGQGSIAINPTTGVITAFQPGVTFVAGAGASGERLILTSPGTTTLTTYNALNQTVRRASFTGQNYGLALALSHDPNRSVYVATSSTVEAINFAIRETITPLDLQLSANVFDENVPLGTTIANLAMNVGNTIGQFSFS